MSEVKINEAAVQELAARVVAQIVARIDADMEPRRGQSAEKVRAALLDSAERHGLDVDAGSDGFQQMVAVLVAGGHITAAD